MALQLRRRDGDLHRCGTELAPEVTFTLSPAVEFELHNQDEQWHPRTVKKTEDTPEGVVLGSYLHGMQDQLQGHNASCGLLRRPLNTAAEVNSHTHMVIMSKAEKQAYTQRNLSKQTGKQTGNKRADSTYHTRRAGRAGTSAAPHSACTRMWWEGSETRRTLPPSAQ